MGKAQKIVLITLEPYMWAPVAKKSSLITSNFFFFFGIHYNFGYHLGSQAKTDIPNWL